MVVSKSSDEFTYAWSRNSLLYFVLLVCIKQVFHREDVLKGNTVAGSPCSESSPVTEVGFQVHGSQVMKEGEAQERDSNWNTWQHKKQMGNTIDYAIATLPDPRERTE